MAVARFVFFFVFKQKTAYEMRISDWSSDVCSSDLAGEEDERATSSDRRPSRQSGLVRLPAAKPEKSQAESVAGQRIEGRVIVVDGDTMLVGSRLVRLHGIDAPHRRQNCVSGVAAWACGERAARRDRKSTRMNSSH